MISRRRFVTLSTSAVLGAPRSGAAQQAGRVYRVGFLGIGSANASTPEAMRLRAAFTDGLRELGWVEGRNLIIERRYAEGIVSRYPDLAAELVRLGVDVITTATGWDGVIAAKHATTTTPIVMLTIADPAAGGLVASLARPGGNVTGIADLSTELIAKRLELLKETLPKVSRVVDLGGSLNQSAAGKALTLEWVAAATALGIRLRRVQIKDLQDFDNVSALIVQERPEALHLRPDPVTFALRTQITKFALTHRIPTVSPYAEFARAGALMSYGTDLVTNFRRGAAFVDKILRGAKPADLPVEQSTKIDLVINLRTARALGVAIPPSLLVRAEEVIE